MKYVTVGCTEEVVRWI